MPLTYVSAALKAQHTINVAKVLKPMGEKAHVLSQSNVRES